MLKEITILRKKFCFPYEWKTAKVIPVYKNGQRNYRPLLVKLWNEFYMIMQLHRYLTKSELLSDSQFGF